MKRIYYSTIAALTVLLAFTACSGTTDEESGSYFIIFSDSVNGTAEATVAEEKVGKAVAGTEITITATANEGYKFVKWTVTGADPDNAAAETTTFIMPKSNVNVKAEFAVIAPVEYDITVTTVEHGKVTVTVDDVEVAKALANTEISIAATPDDDYEFVKWTLTGADPDNADHEITTFIMPEGEVIVEAEFAAIPKYDITVTSADNGKVSITVKGAETTSAVEGAEVTLTAIPDDGYGLVEWILGGAISDNTSSATTTFIMPKGHVTIEAGFVFIPEGGVLINGVVWATCNVDAPGTFAETFKSTGMFYQWGRKVGWSSTDPLINSDGGTTEDWDWRGYNGREWLPENDPSPEGWRVPTHDELKKLCDMEKVTIEMMGMTDEIGELGYPIFEGLRFTDKASGNWVFFPGCGSRGSGYGERRFVDVSGSYWTSTIWTGPNGYYMSFNSTGRLNSYASSQVSNGFTVRPVAK